MRMMCCNRCFSLSRTRRMTTNWKPTSWHGRTISRYKIMNYWRRQNPLPKRYPRRFWKRWPPSRPRKSRRNPPLPAILGIASASCHPPRELVELRYQRELKRAIADLKNWTPILYVALSAPARCAIALNPNSPPMNPMPEAMNDPRLTLLIDRYLDGSLSPAEKIELETELLAHARAPTILGASSPARCTARGHATQCRPAKHHTGFRRPSRIGRCGNITRRCSCSSSVFVIGRTITNPLQPQDSTAIGRAHLSGCGGSQRV